MSAVQKLFVDGGVARFAVRGAHAGVDDEAIVVRAGLAGGDLMAIKAGDAFFGVFAQLVFVDDGILKIAVALGALAAGTDKGRAGLFDLDPGAAGIHQKRR